MEIRDDDGVFLLAAGLIPYLLMQIPLGQVTHKYEVFIAADPKTVWDTYFIHVRGTDYRPRTRLLGYRILSENPLTVQITVKGDSLPMPVTTVFTYEVYEPYTRYKLHSSIGSAKMVEEGEFLSELGGARLRLAVTVPRRGLLLPLLARRRVNGNLRALQNVCEGRGALKPTA